MKFESSADISPTAGLWPKFATIGLLISFSGCVSFTAVRYVPDNPENTPTFRVQWSSGKLINESGAFIDRKLVAASQKAKVLAVWTTCQTVASGEHNFWSSLRDKGVWSKAQCFHQLDSCETSLCDLCVDTAGNFHVLYSHRDLGKRAAPTEYWVQTFTEGRWSPPEKAAKECFGVFWGMGAIWAHTPDILHAVFVAQYPAEMRGYGIFHGEFPYKIFHIKRESGRWSSRIQVNEVGRYYTFGPSLVAGPTGTLHLAYERLNFGIITPSYSEASYQKFQGGSWSRPVRLGKSEIVGFRPVKVVLDSENMPHITWRGPANTAKRPNIRHAYEENGKWNLEIIGKGYRPYAATDKFGNVHVVWLGKGSVCSHRFWHNGRWSKTSVIAGASAGPLAVGPGDTLHLIWTEQRNRNLWYMRGVVKPLE